MLKIIKQLFRERAWTSIKSNKTGFLLLGLTSSGILFQQYVKVYLKWIHFPKPAIEEIKKVIAPSQQKPGEQNEPKYFRRLRKVEEYKEKYVSIKGKYNEIKQSKQQNLIGVHCLNSLINFAGFIINPTFFFIKLHLTYASFYQAYYFSSFIEKKAGIQLFFSEKFTEMGLILAGINGTFLALSILRALKKRV